MAEVVREIWVDTGSKGRPFMQKCGVVFADGKMVLNVLPPGWRGWAELKQVGWKPGAVQGERGEG